MATKKVPSGKATFFKTQPALRAWFNQNHDKASDLVIGFYKKDSGQPGITYREALDEALCFGWIDAIRQSIDTSCYSIRFTPRKPKSIWSVINVKRAGELTDLKRMKPAGLKQIEVAKQDGRWAAAYEGQRVITVPDDLREALNRNKGAAAFFATLDSKNRYAVLFRIHTAKKAETRARRIEQFVGMLARKEKLHP
jgi:uncharacterized protein YdeI (YjbR/CyaY-like superfamily)